MSIEETLGNAFKSEVKSSGSKLFEQEKVSLSSVSDIGIQAFVRVAPPFKVQLSSEGIDSQTLLADCSCPAAKKERLCKHIWATLLCVEQKHPDFLSLKKVIEKVSGPADAQEEKQSAFQESAKLRAAEYRKVQYQKLKMKEKERKRGSKGRESPTAGDDLPVEVRAALDYFTLNGFSMSDGPSEAVLGDAKRRLSRIFHPDRGGTHAEVVELNKNCELIARYFRL